MGEDVDELRVEVVAPLPGILDKGLDVEGVAGDVVEDKVRLGCGELPREDLTFTKSADTGYRNGGFALDVPG